MVLRASIAHFAEMLLDTCYLTFCKISSPPQKKKLLCAWLSGQDTTESEGQNGILYLDNFIPWPQYFLGLLWTVSNGWLSTVANCRVWKIIIFLDQNNWSSKSWDLGEFYSPASKTQLFQTLVNRMNKYYRFYNEQLLGLYSAYNYRSHKITECFLLLFKNM